MRKKVGKYGNLIKKYLRDQKRWITVLSILMIITTGLQLIAPQMLSRVIDGIVGDSTPKQIVLLLVVFLAVTLLEELVKLVTTLVSNRVGWTATNRMREDLIERCLKQTEESLQNFKSGELIEIIDGDVQKLTNFFSTLVVALVQAGLLVIGTLIVIFMENWLIGLSEIVFVTCVFIIFGKIHNIAASGWRKDREHASEFYGYLGECIEAKEDLKANGRSSYALEQIHQLLKKWLPDNIKAGVLGYVSYAVYLIIVAISYAIVFGFGAFFWIRGLISVGTIFLLYQYNQNLIHPVQRLRRQLEDLQKVTASIERISVLYSQPLEDEGGQPLEKGEGLEISVRNLSFSYKPQTPVLQNVSFSLESNQLMGVIGRTGSGKTTLVKLLTKLYPVSEGEIFINQLSLSDICIDSLRENIVYVTQEVQIFDASFRDNITFFDEEVKDNRLLELIEELGLQEWFEGLEEGLDTRINGHKMSAGQAQLIALIRAFLKDARLIILDEAYANIDPLTEKYIQNVMRRLFVNRTGIIIAHRLNTLEQVDKVILMEKGSIVESGSYQELKEDATSKLYQLLRQNISEVLA